MHSLNSNQSDSSKHRPTKEQVALENPETAQKVYEPVSDPNSVLKGRGQVLTPIKNPRLTSKHNSTVSAVGYKHLHWSH